MKNDSIQQLLGRYREGTLSDSELAELNRLTHRDEVMADAERRAGGIIRRRRTLAFTAAGILLAGGVVWSLLPQQQETTLVAEATVPEVVELPAPTVEQSTLQAPAVKKSAPRKVAVQKPATLTTTTIEQIAEDETVVMCNNQCEADSVINDIWKFLTV